MKQYNDTYSMNISFKIPHFGFLKYIACSWLSSFKQESTLLNKTLSSIELAILYFNVKLLSAQHFCILEVNAITGGRSLSWPDMKADQAVVFKKVKRLEV